MLVKVFILPSDTSSVAVGGAAPVPVSNIASAPPLGVYVGALDVGFIVMGQDVQCPGSDEVLNLEVTTVSEATASRRLAIQRATAGLAAIAGL